MLMKPAGLGARLTLFALLALFLLLAAGRATALPVYARKYHVPCQTCHTVVPRLNPFGLAFQANHFNWPGGAAFALVALVITLALLAGAGKLTAGAERSA